MNIAIHNNSDLPIYEQISMQIKNNIINGTLKSGDPLPSIRLLAKELRISVITTKRAYEELEKENFIETVPGKGSFVAPSNGQTIQEEQRRRIEKTLQETVYMAKSNSISKKELQEMINYLYEEEL